MGQEEMLAQHLRMAEYADIIIEWRTKISTMSQEPTTGESTGISSKDLSALACSFKGNEAIAKLRAREEDMLATSTSLASRKEMTKDNNALKIAKLVTTGAEVLSMIETQGDRVINKLSVTQLHALHIRADPHKNATKPSKKDGPSMARELEFVKATLRRHGVANPADVAPVPAIEAPQISQLDINRGSFGSVASSPFFPQMNQGGVGMLAAPNVVLGTAAPVPD
jgi:hypothetical protein